MSRVGQTIGFRRLSASGTLLTPGRPQKAMVCPTHLRRQARAAQQLLESGIAPQEVVFGRRFQ